MIDDDDSRAALMAVIDATLILALTHEIGAFALRVHWNAKRKGSRVERRTIALLSAQGYACTKCGGSLDVFHVIGIGERDVVLCQVKSNRWPSKAEMDVIAKFAVLQNCRKIIHR